MWCVWCHWIPLREKRMNKINLIKRESGSRTMKLHLPWTNPWNIVYVRRCDSAPGTAQGCPMDAAPSPQVRPVPGSSYLAKVSRLYKEAMKARGYLANCLTSGWLPNLPRRGPFTMLGPRGHDHNAASLPEHWGSYIVFWRAPRWNVCIQVHVGWTAPVDQHGHQLGRTTLRFPPHYQQV